MKNSTILILGLIALVLLLVGPVWAGAASDITVTVTPKLISLSVTPSTYDYGTLGTSETAETTITFVVNNDGTVDEDFYIKGAGSSGDWTLGATAGNETYRHDWKEAVSGSYAPLTTGGVPAAASVAGGNSESFKFQLYTPTSTGATAAQNPNVTFTALES